MVAPGTQKKQRKAEAKAKAAAKAKVETEVSKLKGKRNQHLSITEDQIRNEREVRGLSWKQVAINLGLGSPGAARAAWKELTGTDHTQSVMSGRAKKGSVTGRKTQEFDWNEDHLDEFELDKLQDTIQETLPGRTIRIRRNLIGQEYDEFIKVRRVQGFRFDGKDEDGPLAVNVTDDDTGASRTFRTRDIVEAL